MDSSEKSKEDNLNPVEPEKIPEVGKLQESPGKLEDKKQLTPEIKTTKVQAGTGVDVNKNTNVGSADINKP